MSNAIAEAPADTTEETGIQSFIVTFNIRRFDPEVDAEPHWVDYCLLYTSPSPRD